jgi:hypothetical protein
MPKLMNLLKKSAKILDEKLFSKRFTISRDIFRTSTWLRAAGNGRDHHSFHINYQSSETFLDTLCHRYGSDKGSAPQSLGEHVLRRKVHNYAEFYAFLFDGIRLNVKTVFECICKEEKTFF